MTEKKLPEPMVPPERLSAAEHGFMTETSRKPLGKRRRFEVFKRDAFTCQYCGRTPPAVVCWNMIREGEGGEKS